MAAAILAMPLALLVTVILGFMGIVAPIWLLPLYGLLGAALTLIFAVLG